MVSIRDAGGEGGYRRQGYAVSRPAGNGPDGGVDLILKKDGNSLLVQCKQWKAWKVGVKVVRELYGVMMDGKADGAIVVTSGIFTQEARAFEEGKPIDLVERQQLAALIRGVQAMPSPSPSSRRSKSASVPAPAQPAPSRASILPRSAQKHCPLCGQPMVLRIAQRGPQAGQQFSGCSRFPTSRETEKYEGDTRPSADVRIERPRSL